MLQDGKLVGIVADVVQQPGEQHRADLASADSHRPGDGALALLARHARHKIFAAIDRLRQALELRAVAKKIRAHGQHDVDGMLRLRRFQQKVHQGGGFLVLGRSIWRKTALRCPESETALRTDRQSAAGSFPASACACSYMSTRPSLLMSSVASIISSSRQAAEIGVDRTGLPGSASARASALIGSPPGRNCTIRQCEPARAIKSAPQGRFQSAVHQRRLAAARGADDRKKSADRELVDHRVDLAFAAEEEVFLLFAERTQSRKRVGQLGPHSRARCVTERLRRAASERDRAASRKRLRGR